MHKKIMFITILMFLITIPLNYASAEELQDISIEMQIGQNEAVVNGKICKIDENESVTAYVENDRTLVPLRFVSEILNLQVEWTEETQTVVLTDENTEIVLQIDNASASVNGDAYALDVRPVLKGARTFVPVRFVTEALQCNVKWEEESQKVTIKRADNYLEQKIAADMLAELEVVKPELYENRETIMDGDCLTILCRGLGTMVNGLGFGSSCYGYTPPREIGSYDERTWMLEGVYAAGTGPGLGLAYTHLLDGRSPGDPEPLHTSHSSDATAKKVVAYMIRCLKNPKIDLADEDATWKRALEIGLVKKNDSFACDPATLISPDDFFVLMYRFVLQPRYYYFDSTNRDYTSSAERCYTYYEGDAETYAEYLERIIPILKEQGKFMHLTNSRSTPEDGSLMSSPD